LVTVIVTIITEVGNGGCRREREIQRERGHTATYCNTLQHTATHCNTLQHSSSSPRLKSVWPRGTCGPCARAPLCIRKRRLHFHQRSLCFCKRALSLALHIHTCFGHYIYTYIFWAPKGSMQYPHCSTLHDTARHCTTLQHTAPRCTTLQHTVTHCNTLQHAATHCKTLQHTLSIPRLKVHGTE